MSIKQTVTSILGKAGIKVNGNNPWDIQVHNEKFYSRVLAGGSLALGESYMDGWWDCESIDEFISKVLKAHLDETVRDKKRVAIQAIKSRILNFQTKPKSRVVGVQHYDVGNELYKAMLDKRMNYSCGYWKNAKTLDQAQESKLELICQKLKLKSGEKVLDVGCGWGSFAKYAAEKYKVSVVGVTISKEQVKLARENCKGLDVEIRFQDYRDVREKFDKIVSIGMFEHVGYKNHRTFFKMVRNSLKDDGLFLLHTIGGSKSITHSDPWVAKYIFPNSMLPSAAQITKACESLFTMKDWHNFGPYYDPTLMSWYANFNKSWDKIKKHYKPPFKRMWDFYLLSSAGSFRSHKNHVWQIVFSKSGYEVEYESIR